jgi:hypothetical protein
MTPRDFCFWFMGSLELIEPEDGLNEKQTQILKNHLNMVFTHIVNEDGTLKDEPLETLCLGPIDYNPSLNC